MSKLSNLILAISILLGAVLVRNFVLEIYIVRSKSMLPNIIEGDYLFTSKMDLHRSWNFLFGFGDDKALLKSGDLVVIKSEQTEAKPMVQRVVAVPGDILTYKAGQLKVNGSSLSESVSQKISSEVLALLEVPQEDQEYFVLKREAYPETTVDVIDYEYGSRESFGPIELRKDEYFLLGDNRPSARDSRYYGVVDQAHISAKVHFRLLSCRKSFDPDIDGFLNALCFPAEWNWNRVFTKIP